MKKLALAVLLPLVFAVSQPANAVSIVSSSFGGQHGHVEVGTEVFLGDSAPSGLFSFTLDQQSKVEFTGFTTLPVLFMGLYDSANSFLAGAGFGSGTFNTAFTTTTLGAGSYYYKPTLITPASTGKVYTFQSRVTPVPEPETYAMLLAGLGLMVTIARRRSKSE